ncbi:hypothetical protein DUF262 [[Clostridium] sordellii]|uniref:DUF262 domain-containing protein n=1 Tax=Paraclostridium sordellii TaxID=1505 RepID=UPI0005DBA047|nr:DUF262 domain-containing protein [Paeniclostridium sordellii]CEN31007.1 hypothetical protein DUF262 [[Clostridium] sordellii] [Paeniclostridium sordellii]
MSNIEEIELLKKQIDDLSYDIYVDSYPMSLSELISFYKDNDINLKADYQRVFKWSNEQKTKFIESLLLGLPIPPIFLYQDDKALWEVVDGIQRLSTVFEFVGILKDSNDEVLPPLTLTSAPKLTHLETLKFSDFPVELQRTFKKCKLDLIIISKKGKKDIKLEVFRRLNGFGTKLNNQELRNALSLLLDPNLFKFIEKMSNNELFLNCFPFKGDEKKDKKHYEYFIRYITLYEINTLKNFKNLVPSYSKATIDDLFDKVIESIANNSEFNLFDTQLNFIKTFSLLSETLGGNAFKKYNHDRDKFSGKISESIFEAIVPGVSKYIEYYSHDHDLLIQKIKNLHLPNSQYKTIMAPNPRAVDRMSKLLNLSLEYFNPHE